jgi:DNA invertase Pin-like site-specific DNA recombinase
VSTSQSADNALPEAFTPDAFSYIRFSHPSQSDGDSLRRQAKAAEEWCARNQARLNTSLTFRDLGKSAFTGAHRQNPDRHALAAFLKLVEQGRVPRGSFLIVESLDRLTREHIRPALTLLLNLIEAGVRIVQLKPVEVVYDEHVEPMQLLVAIMELNRGHSESAVKSDRVGGAWAGKKEAARKRQPQPPRKKDGRITQALTSRLPSWMEERGGRIVLIPERAAAVRRIFQLAAAGYGLTATVKKLIAEKFQPFGGREFYEDKEGKRRYRRGQKHDRLGSGKWARSYVGAILKDERAIGVFQPRKSDGTEDGDPIPKYYPAAVKEEEWNAARAGAAERKTRRGRNGTHVNIFANLLRSARDGGTYFAATRTDGHKPGRRGQTQRVLINTESWAGRAPCYSFPYDTFETAVLEKLQEIDPHEILNGDDGPDESLVLAGELAEVEARIADIVADLEANGESPTQTRRLREKESRQAELVKLLAGARERARHPLSEVWGEAQSLAAALASAPDPQDARLRLRSKLRGIIDSIYLLVVPRGRSRLLAAQIIFRKDSGHAGKVRDYLVCHVPPRSNGRARVEGRSRVWSLLDVVKSDDLDLRRPEDAAALEMELAALDLAGLAAGGPRAGEGEVE